MSAPVVVELLQALVPTAPRASTLACQGLTLPSTGLLFMFLVFKSLISVSCRMARCTCLCICRLLFFFNFQELLCGIRAVALSGQTHPLALLELCMRDTSTGMSIGTNKSRMNQPDSNTAIAPVLGLLVLVSE